MANRSSQTCFFSRSISTAASYGNSFCLCVLLLVPVLPSALFFAGFLQVTPSRLAVHSTLLLTSVNYNIVFLVVRHLRFCCPYFIMCYLHSEFDSSVCYIFPSLAMGSFKLTLMPRSDTSSCFRILLSWQSDIGLLSSSNSVWTICRPLPRGWFGTELGLDETISTSHILKFSTSATIPEPPHLSSRFWCVVCTCKAGNP